MAAHRVHALLMGGQACVFYGAAEFSRDTDLLILTDADNLGRLEAAWGELEAECIAVPPFAADYLERGHAVHFRCHHPDAADMRVDLMAKLRGLEEFPALWERRTVIADADEVNYELLSLPDLVQAKKTQRSKDWPMLQRLVEVHYLKHRTAANPEQQQFWLRELRTPELLVEAAHAWPQIARLMAAQRPLLALAQADTRRDLEEAILTEERAERERDRVYWQPLRAELEQLRQAARK
jgi:hypothetical protein